MARRVPNRQRLIRRLHNLRNLEWFNSVFLIVVFSLTWSDLSIESIWQRLLAYLPLASLLIMGGWYWHLKLRQVRDRLPLDRHMGRFAGFQRLALLVLSIGSTAVAVSWVADIGTVADRAWATGFLLFAWAEYVNYFKVQLMHDTVADLSRLSRTHRLRRSALAVDLAAWRRQG